MGSCFALAINAVGMHKRPPALGYDLGKLFRRCSVIKIITDSTCDIPAELIEKYGIDVVPCYLIWGNEQYRDRVDLQPEEFYRRIEANLSDRPTSSQPLAWTGRRIQAVSLWWMQIPARAGTPPLQRH